MSLTIRVIALNASGLVTTPSLMGIEPALLLWDLVSSIKVLTRAHQSMIWTRQRQTNQLRSTLREFYPAALEVFGDLAHSDALAVLAIAPTPALGRQLSISKIRSGLKRGGRQRRLDQRATEIQTALRSEQLAAPDQIATAMGSVVAALVGVIGELNTQIAALETQLAVGCLERRSGTDSAGFVG